MKERKKERKWRRESKEAKYDANNMGIKGRGADS